MNVVVIGDGLLGAEVVRQSGWDFISRKKHNIDFCNIDSYAGYLIGYDTVFNCVGYTNTYSDEKEKHIDTNFKAVVELTNFCNVTKKKIVHISSDYIYSNSCKNASEDDVPSNCTNWYAYSKLLGDGYVHSFAKDYLLIRTSFRPKPFPYQKISLQWGNFDYVDQIVWEIVSLIKKNACGIFNVGRTSSWSNVEMSKMTRNDVEIRSEKVYDSLPDDVTMNTLKALFFLRDNK